MKYIKRNKYNVYDKICKVIASCNSIRQLSAAYNMINLFDKLYDNKYLYASLIEEYYSKKTILLLSYVLK